MIQHPRDSPNCLTSDFSGCISCKFFGGAVSDTLDITADVSNRPLQLVCANSPSESLQNSGLRRLHQPLLSLQKTLKSKTWGGSKKQCTFHKHPERCWGLGAVWIQVRKASYSNPKNNKNIYIYILHNTYISMFVIYHTHTYLCLIHHCMHYTISCSHGVTMMTRFRSWIQPNSQGGCLVLQGTARIREHISSFLNQTQPLGLGASFTKFMSSSWI